MADDRPHNPAAQLALLALAQLAAMTLWFSATAVLPALRQSWHLSATGAAWMTAAVQVGFVAGALGSALLNLPDVVPPRRMIAASALGGAVANLALAHLAGGVTSALVLRFVTGVFLAGVYPPGMKVAAGHVSGRARGVAIGVLVGALTVGSATPHLVAGLLGGGALPYRTVLTISSALAAGGALVVIGLVRDGPHAPARAPFDPSQVRAVLTDRPVLLANLGYFGHMWELYAMWAWLIAYLSISLTGVVTTRVAAFAIIGVAGGIGAVGGGVLADRIGRTTVTIAAMLVSGSCCLASPAVAGAAAPVVVVFGLVWGAAIVADSAQFSAAVTELARPEYIGTALTLQTSLGFALTLIPIWSLPYLAQAVGWQYAFVALAPGPLLGTLAMRALRRRPESRLLAGGRR